MTSTRSSYYGTIGGGSNGVGSKSRSSRWLARGPPPGGKEDKEDEDSTPVAFDANDGDDGQVEVNGECKGNGNHDGPVDKNNDDDYAIYNDENNNDGGGQDRSANVG